MPLYGNELDRDDEPVRGRPRPRRQARQARRLRRPGGAREGRRATGPRKRLVGLVDARAAGSPATATRSTPATRRTGVVTSGTQSPTLGEPIAMAYVAPGRCRAGYDARRRDPRSARCPPRSSPLPFYRRPADGGRRSRRDARPSRARPQADSRRSEGGAPRWSPTDLRYTKDHEWVRVEGDEATIGITDYAADQLGDIVFVELPEVGRALEPVRDVRRRRVGQGGQRPVRARRRRGRRGQRRARRRAGAGQQRPVRRGLDGPRASSPTPAELDELLDAAAYDALIAAG